MKIEPAVYEQLIRRAWIAGLIIGSSVGAFIMSTIWAVATRG